MVLARKPPVTIHDEGDVLWYWPLLDRVYEKLL
jgi:hypothetical protein